MTETKFQDIETTTNNRPDEEVYSIFKMEKKQLLTDPHIAAFPYSARRSTSNYGTAYRLEIQFPGMYTYTFTDRAVVTGRDGSRNTKKAFEMFNQEDFFALMQATKSDIEAKEVTGRAFVRLVKGTSEKNGEPAAWYRLEVLLGSDALRVCKSSFISKRVALTLEYVCPKFAKNPFISTGRVPEEAVAAEDVVEELPF